MGPISYLIVEFPGNKMTGEGFAGADRSGRPGRDPDPRPRFVTCRADGSVEAIQLRELDTDGQFDLTIFEGVSSGLLDQSDFDDAAKALAAGLVGRHLDLRESMGDRLRGGDAPRRWRVGGGGLHPAGGHRRLARRDRGRLIRQIPDEKGRGHARTAQRCRPHGGGGGHGDRGLQPRLAATGQSLDATERSAGVRAATAVPAAQYASRRRNTPSRLLPPPRRTGSDRAAEEAGRAQEPGDPHRRRVPGAEGERSSSM